MGLTCKGRPLPPIGYSWSCLSAHVRVRLRIQNDSSCSSPSGIARSKPLLFYSTALTCQRGAEDAAAQALEPPLGTPPASPLWHPRLLGASH